MENWNEMVARVGAAWSSPQLKSTGAKTKPVGRFTLFMLELIEPVQDALLGGSNMAWVRFMAEMNHRFGHLHIRLGGNPEQTMEVQ